MLILVAIAAAFFSTPLLAQQTGDITGQVTNAADGTAIEGVSIEATSPVLRVPVPQSRQPTVITDYRRCRRVHTLLYIH